MFAVIGVIRNRKTKKIKVTHSKYLMPGAIVSLIIIGTGILFVPIESIGNLIYIIGYYNGSIIPPAGVTDPHVTYIDVLGGCSQIIMLFIFLGIMFIPGIVRHVTDHRKGIDKISHKHY
jgi:hypothetical protein